MLKYCGHKLVHKQCWIKFFSLKMDTLYFSEEGEESEEEIIQPRYDTIEEINPFNRHRKKEGQEITRNHETSFELRAQAHSEENKPQEEIPSNEKRPTLVRFDRFESSKDEEEKTPFRTASYSQTKEGESNSSIENETRIISQRIEISNSSLLNIKANPDWLLSM